MLPRKLCHPCKKDENMLESGPKYQRIFAPEMEDFDPERLVPKRRTRHYRCFGFVIVAFLSITALGLCVYIYGYNACFSTSDFFSGNETKSNSSSRQATSESQIDCKGFFQIAVVVLFAWTFARFTYLVVLFCEELHHIQQCHKGSFKETFIFVFISAGEKMWYCAVCISIILMLYSFKFYHVPFHDLIVRFLIIYLGLFYIFNNQGCHPIEVDIFSNNFSSLGAVLAVGMHYGYLEILESRKKTIKQRIQEYKAKHQLDANILFPEKLFILFPTSCYTYKNLANADSKRIQERQKLKEVVIERAGITERTFNNSVYNIIDKPKEHDGVSDNNIGTPKEYLVAVEYATPLDTIYNLSERGTVIHLSREERRDVMLRCYGELKMLLQNDHACSDTYVLVLYDDEAAEDRTSCMLNALIKKIKETLNAEN